MQYGSYRILCCFGNQETFIVAFHVYGDLPDCTYDFTMWDMARKPAHYKKPTTIPVYTVQGNN